MHFLKEIISDRDFFIELGDSIKDAFDKFRASDFSMIPVLKDEKLIGLLELSKLSTENGLIINDLTPYIIKDYQYLDIHDDLYTIVSKSMFYKNLFFPVNDAQGYHLGIVRTDKLNSFLGNFNTFTSSGGSLVISLHPSDYSLGEIGRLIELENCKIMGLMINDTNLEDNAIELILKIQGTHLKRALASLERHNYKIIDYKDEIELQNTDLKENFESLINYLNV